MSSEIMVKRDFKSRREMTGENGCPKNECLSHTMIDLGTYHAVLLSVMLMSACGLLIVLWLLNEQGVEGITCSEGLPLKQGAFILSFSLPPRTTVVFAYRLTFASRTL